MKTTLLCGLAAAAATATATILVGGAQAAQTGDSAASLKRSLAVRGSATAIVSNDFIEVATDPNGNITIGTTGGDPANPDDDFQEMTYGHPGGSTSGVTLRVDGVDYYSQSSSYDFAPFALDAVTSPTVNGSDAIVTAYAAAGVELLQTYRIVENSATGRADVVELTFQVQNTDPELGREVALRYMIDTELAGNDGAPFRVPGLGDVTFEDELLGDAIPASYLVFDDFTSPTLICAGTMRGGSAVVPNRVIWGDWGNLYDTAFDYEVPGEEEIFDSGVAYYWSATLEPQETRTFRTYYGLGDFTGSTGPLNAALEAPVTLSRNGANLSPNPFAVTLFLSNDDFEAIFEQVSAEIDLPTGLTLAAGETATKQLGTIFSQGSADTTWRVHANGNLSGTLPVRVTYTFEEGDVYELTRFVNIPNNPFPFDEDPTGEGLADWTFYQFNPDRGTPGVEVFGERVSGVGLATTLTETDNLETTPGHVYFGAWMPPFQRGTQAVGFVNPPPNWLLNVQWTVSSTAVDRTHNPILRARATSVDASHSYEAVHQAPFEKPLGAASAVPTLGVDRIVELWAVAAPTIGDGFGLDPFNPDGFDIPFDVYATEGIGLEGTRVALKGLTMQIVDPASLGAGTAVAQLDFTAGVNGFAASPENPVSGALGVVYSADENGLGILPNNAPENGGTMISFGFFDSDAPLFNAEANTVYKTVYTVGSDAPTSSDVPTIRWRYLINDGFDFAHNSVSTAVGDSKAMPIAGTDTTFTTYTVFPPQFAGVGVTAAFDVYRDQAKLGGRTVWLRNVTVTKHPLP